LIKKSSQDRLRNEFDIAAMHVKQTLGANSTSQPW